MMLIEKLPLIWIDIGGGKLIKSKNMKDSGNRPPSARDIIIKYFTIFSVVIMLFGILLLPSTQIMAHNEGLIDELTSDKKLSTYNE